MHLSVLDQYKYRFVDAVMLSDTTNIGYMTGFWGTFARLIITRAGKKIFISNSLYSGTAQQLCDTQNIEYREITREKDFFSQLCTQLNIKTLGIESNEVTIERWKNMKKGFDGIKLVPLPKTIEDIRLLKTEDEIAKLRTAAQIGDKALKKTITYFKEGISEKEIAWIFERTAREEFGADGLSFDPVVAFGEHTAIPHHSPTSKKLKNSMPILIDCGVKKDGYSSDLTRCFWFGSQESNEYKEWNTAYTLVHKAQKTGIEKMIPGTKIAESDISARKVLGDEAKYFGHTFGHGVGLDVHEAPIVSSRNEKQKYQSGMVVTAEPGIYYAGKFGIRIEDLLVIGDEKAELLSGFEYFL